MNPDKNMSHNCELEAFDEEKVQKKDGLDQETFAQYKTIGDQLIKDGKVSVIILAGGQGSRLGFDHPKGMYKIPGIHKSIFQFLTERFFRV